MSVPQQTALCEAVYNEYRPSEGHLDLATLYSGLGGNIIESGGTGEDVLPPSYHELESPPPMPPLSPGKTDRLPPSRRLPVAPLAHKYKY